MVDDRDGTSLTYKTIKIGKKTWMAENLRYPNGTKGRDYFSADGNSANDEEYGYLYTWDAAQTACPAEKGWRLPANEDFEDLLGIVSLAKVSESNFLALIAKSQAWTDYEDKGGDDFGFGALPAGICDKNSCIYYGKFTSFWSSTTSESNSAHSLVMTQGTAYVFESSKNMGSVSVRCIKD